MILLILSYIPVALGVVQPSFQTISVQQNHPVWPIPQETVQVTSQSPGQVGFDYNPGPMNYTGYSVGYQFGNLPVSVQANLTVYVQFSIFNNASYLINVANTTVQRRLDQFPAGANYTMLLREGNWSMIWLRGVMENTVAPTQTNQVTFGPMAWIEYSYTSASTLPVTSASTLPVTIVSGMIEIPSTIPTVNIQNLTVASSEAFITGNWTDIFLSGTLTVNASINGSIRLVEAQNVYGQFDAIQSTYTNDCQEYTVEYSQTTVDVLVSRKRCGTPVGIIVGACLGAILAGILIAVLIRMWYVYKKRVFMKQASEGIRDRQVEELKRELKK